MSIKEGEILNQGANNFEVPQFERERLCVIGYNLDPHASIQESHFV